MIARISSSQESGWECCQGKGINKAFFLSLNKHNNKYFIFWFVSSIPTYFSLNKAVIEEYFNSLSSTGNFKCYKDLRRHWKNIVSFYLGTYIIKKPSNYVFFANPYSWKRDSYFSIAWLPFAWKRVSVLRSQILARGSTYLP